MTECPETLRSEGVAPKPAPVRKRAWATYKRLGHGRAFVEVTYLGAPDLFSMSRVEVGVMSTWRVGTRGGRKTFARVEALPKGRTLFVDCRDGTWRAYSAHDGLDAPSAEDAVWCDETVFVASGGAGPGYFDAW